MPGICSMQAYTFRLPLLKIVANPQQYMFTLSHLQCLHACRAEAVKVARRKANEQRGMPEVLEAQRLAYVKAQLETARRALGEKDRAQHRWA